MKTKDMKTTVTWILLLALGRLAVLAGESGDIDHERSLVKQGVLGTVNVLRELDVKTWTNRVTVTSNVEGFNSKPEATITIENVEENQAWQIILTK